MPSPGLGTPAYENNDAESASEWNKNGQSAGASLPYGSKEGEMIINAAPQAVKEIPSSRSRRWWLFLVGYPLSSCVTWAALSAQISDSPGAKK
jgi:chitin synthase